MTAVEQLMIAANEAEMHIMLSKPEASSIEADLKPEVISLLKAAQKRVLDEKAE